MEAFRGYSQPTRKELKKLNDNELCEFVQSVINVIRYHRGANARLNGENIIFEVTMFIEYPKHKNTVQLLTEYFETNVEELTNSLN